MWLSEVKRVKRVHAPGFRVGFGTPSRWIATIAHEKHSTTPSGGAGEVGYERGTPHLIAQGLLAADALFPRNQGPCVLEQGAVKR